jgi:hypothetical protein
MTDDYIYDASLVSENVWLDFWRLNGEARITIERPSPSGGDPALMQPPQQNATTIAGVRTIVFEVSEQDIRTSAGRLVVGDRKFETLDEIKYGDRIIFGHDTYEVFRVDSIIIGEMKIYSTKTHKVG